MVERTTYHLNTQNTLLYNGDLVFQGRVYKVSRLNHLTLCSRKNFSHPERLSCALLFRLPAATSLSEKLRRLVGNAIARDPNPDDYEGKCQRAQDLEIT